MHILTPWQCTVLHTPLYVALSSPHRTHVKNTRSWIHAKPLVRLLQTYQGSCPTVAAKLL